MSDPSQRVGKLRELLLRAKQAYYVGATPVMSDEEYDALEEELRTLAPDDPLLLGVGVPSGGAVEGKARHRIPMGSQAKVNSADDLQWWYENCGGGRIHGSLKGDGASAAAYYVDGRLEQVVSRGDGFVGEDITANARRFRGLPAFVEDERARRLTGAVRFEVILTKAEWARVDPAMAKNPRNLGNGIMGRKDGRYSDCLTAFAFDLDEAGVPLASELDKCTRLAALGFRCVPYRLCDDLDAAVAYFEEVVETRASLEFWIDGVVLKIDDLARQRALGSTAGRPKGQVAWKFASQGAETVVRGYSLSGGHTGVIVPTASVDPVEIGGTTVRNVTLNNWDRIDALDVAIGDRVWLVKANDIIPMIVEVRERAPSESRRPILEPQECPFCGAPTGRRRKSAGDAGAATVCTDADCPMKSSQRIKRWIKGLDILGIGDALREAMIEQLDLADPSGLYRLRDDPPRLAALVLNSEKDLHLGEKRAEAVLAAIERTRAPTLATFLGSLGIEGLGPRRVEQMIVAAGGRLDRLADWRAGRLRGEEFAAECGVPSLGERIQDGIDAMGEVMDNLLAAGVGVVEPTAGEPTRDADPQRLTVCITGKLPSGRKKSDYGERLERAGYRLVDEVSRDLDLLVLADPRSTSAKATRARKFGIRLLSEAELEELLAPAP